MIAGLAGLGQWVLLAARFYKPADLFAGVMLLGAIGLVANSALSLAEGRLLKWRGDSGGVRRSSALRRRPFACQFTQIARRPRAASAPFRL